MITEQEYTEAENDLLWIEQTKELMVSMLNKLTDGKLINAKDYEICAGQIKEAIGEMCYDKKIAAEDKIRNYKDE